MNVTKETILEYLFDRLDIERRSEVEEALRGNDELHAFFCERLSHIRELQPDALFVDQAESVGDEGIDDDGADSLVYDRDNLELRTGNEEFDRYLGLPPEEAARRYMIEILEKRSAAAVNLAVSKVYHARSEGVALAANHVAAKDTEGNASGPQDQSEPYKFTWKEIPSKDAILLTFVDHSRHVDSRRELLLDVSFTYELKDSGEEFEVNVGIVRMVEKSTGIWTGQFGLAGFGLKVINISIMTLKGRV